MAMAVIRPLEKRGPDHWIVLPRALFLAPFVRQGLPTLSKTAANGWRAKLQGVAPRFRDRAVERSLGFQKSRE